MSKITVTTIAGLTSGGDANTVKIESGDAFQVVSGATTLGGDLAVDTNVLKVDSSNNRVGINTTSPSDDFELTPSADGKGITLKTTGNIRPYLNLESNRSAAGNNLSQINFKWNGTDVARIIAVAGTDTTNKDDAHLTISTASAGSPAERIRVKPNGTIGLGTHGSANNINDTILLTATGNGSHDTHFWSFGPHFTSDNPSFYTINESGTGVYLPTGNNSWSAHSDERIKENITPLENVLPDIKNIRCVKYNLKGQSATKIGFIAQDWETKFSEVVDENSRQVIESDGSLSFDTESESTTKVKALSYTETIPVLLKAIQELESKVKALESK